MTYTVSHRQQGAKRSAVGGLVRHTFRDVDKSNGRETQHSNERIIPERTHLNESWMWVDGQKVALENSQQILDELDSRLEKAGGTRTNKKTGKVTRIAVREDAKVVRDLVLQLDPKFTRSSEWMTDPEISQAERDERQAEMRRITSEMIEHYGDLYGRHNLLAASLHLDETSPHLHLMLTPIDDQGRVRQESFINGRQAMRANDQTMRQRVKAAGYDVDEKPRGGNRSNMSIDEYAQWQERVEEIEAREIEVEDREVRWKKNIATQRKNKAWLDKKKEAHDEREASLSSREASVAAKDVKATEMAQRGAQELSRGREMLRKAKDEGQAAQDAKLAFKEGERRAALLERESTALLDALREGSRVTTKKRYAEDIQPVQKTRSRALGEYNDWATKAKPKADEWEPEM